MPGRLPVFFVCHGGGPMPVLGDPGHAELIQGLRSFEGVLGPRLKDVRAILVISGHHEAQVPTVTSGATPPLFYDYYGFPPESYKITYPAPGSPALATRVQTLLKQAGIPSQADPARGFDHGVFIPLKLMLPNANIPVVQLSMQAQYDPAFHLKMGAAISTLRDEGVLILGSGMTYHNMRGFMSRSVNVPLATQFLQWLIQACCSDEATRVQALKAWASAPGARDSQPHEDHLVPLFVCAGAAGADRGRSVFPARMLGAPTTGFQFDD
eukprot:EG_transcript_17986